MDFSSLVQALTGGLGEPPKLSEDQPQLGNLGARAYTSGLTDAPTLQELADRRLEELGEMARQRETALARSTSEEALKKLRLQSAAAYQAYQNVFNLQNVAGAFAGQYTLTYPLSGRAMVETPSGLRSVPEDLAEPEISQADVRANGSKRVIEI